MRNILQQNLSNDEMKRVYELSDGERGTREIAKMSGIGSNKTIAVYWGKWKSLGIVEPSPNFKGRYQKIISLAEVGIEGPSVVTINETSGTSPREPSEPLVVDEMGE